MNKRKLYLITIIACIAGYIWVFVSYKNVDKLLITDIEVCPIKIITNIPCPSCGSTRAVLLFIKGDILSSILLNPIGLILISIMVFCPLWILYDVITRKESYYKFYKKTEQILRLKWIAIPAIILVLLNWIWNIYKGL
jgi:hypothetical protein